MAIGEKGISLVVAILIAAVVISAASLTVFLTQPTTPEEFVIKADRVVMSNWEMEPVMYAGRAVTKITIGSSEISGLYVSPLEVSAKTQSATNLVLYATYVEGTVHGITSGWAGSDIPHDALELLLPPENAVQENVTMRVLYLTAESMKLGEVVIRSPCHTQPRVVTQSNSWMVKRGFDGPISYTCPQGKTTGVTKITAERIEGPISLAWKNWEQKAAATVQKNVLVYSTFTTGSSYRMTFGWYGDQIPPNLAGLPEPCTMYDVEIRSVYIEAAEIDLTGVEMKVS